MALQNPPGFLQNAGDTHTGAQMRMTFGSHLAGTSGGATSLRPRGGVHPALGQEYVVTQTGSPSMGVLVEPGIAWVPGSLAGTQGIYCVINDAQVTLSVTAAHATLPRIDLVCITVRDSFYSGADDDAILQVVAGTPNSSPVAPSTPDNSLIIAQLAVAAADASIVNADITDRRAYIAAVGGVMNIRSISVIPASAELNEGQLLWAMDTNILYAWDGSGAKQIYPHYPPFVRKTSDETVNNSSALQNDNQLALPVEANSVYKFECLLVYSSGTTPDFKFGWTYPVGMTMDYVAFALAASTFLGFPQTETTVPALDGTGSNAAALLKGTVVVSSTAGTLQLQWAQNTANLSDTIVRAESYLSLVKES